jgi:hypothetical protein
MYCLKQCTYCDIDTYTKGTLRKPMRENLLESIFGFGKN